MLDSVVSGLVGKREQKMILAEVMSAEQRRSLVDQIAIRGQVAVRSTDVGFALAHQIEKMKRPLPGFLQENFAKVLPGDQGRIHERREGHRLERNVLSARTSRRQGGREFPT